MLLTGSRQANGADNVIFVVDEDNYEYSYYIYIYIYTDIIYTICIIDKSQW